MNLKRRVLGSKLNGMKKKERDSLRLMKSREIGLSKREVVKEEAVSEEVIEVDSEVETEADSEEVIEADSEVETEADSEEVIEAVSEVVIEVVIEEDLEVEIDLNKGIMMRALTKDMEEDKFRREVIMRIASKDHHFMEDNNRDSMIIVSKDRKGVEVVLVVEEEEALADLQEGAEEATSKPEDQLEEDTIKIIFYLS